MSKSVYSLATAYILLLSFPFCKKKEGGGNFIHLFLHLDVMSVIIAAGS